MVRAQYPFLNVENLLELSHGLCGFALSEQDMGDLMTRGQGLRMFRTPHPPPVGQDLWNSASASLSIFGGHHPGKVVASGQSIRMVDADIRCRTARTCRASASASPDYAKRPGGTRSRAE